MRGRISTCSRTTCLWVPPLVNFPPWPPSFRVSSSVPLSCFYLCTSEILLDCVCAIFIVRFRGVFWPTLPKRKRKKLALAHTLRSNVKRANRMQVSQYLVLYTGGLFGAGQGPIGGNPRCSFDGSTPWMSSNSGR